MEHLSDDKLKELRDAAEGHSRPRRNLPFNPEQSSIYGGVSGARLGVEQFEVVSGLVIRKTFAHVMAPYIMAFAPPDSPSKPHPGPWRSVSGGAGFDVHIEVALAEGASPVGFDRINTIWWILSLLRLITGLPLVLPVMSDTRFAEAAHSLHEPRLWPIEASRPRLEPSASDDTISGEHLAAVATLFAPGAAVMNIGHFNRAYQTWDQAPFAHSTGAAMVMIWAALETLFRPGPNDLTKRLSKSIATHLEKPGSKREAIQQKIATLYELRGSSVHDSREATGVALADSASLARRAFISCMGEGAAPDSEALLQRWSAEHTQNQ
jgi:hypothetical protein